MGVNVMQKKYKSKFKTIRLLSVLPLVIAFHETLNASGLSYQQFADYGVTFGEKAIPVEQKKTSLKSHCSPPYIGCAAKNTDSTASSFRIGKSVP